MAGTNDHDWSVRTEVCEALHDLGLQGESLVALCHPLIRLANDDPNFIVRSAAAQALRFYPSAEVVSVLQAIAETDHECHDEFMVESAAAMAEESIRYIRALMDRG